MIKLTSTNGLRTKAVNQGGRIYVIAKCKSSNGNLEVAKIPAEYGMYWFPLSFYFDYYYYTNYNSILLKVDDNAPKEVQKEFPTKDKPIFLHNFYNYRKDELGKDTRMYLLNLSITTKLKSMGLTTWEGFYNLQSVSKNYELLSNSLEKVKGQITQRELDKGKDPDKLMNNPIDYATDQESSYLADLGLGYRMTSYMRKVAGVQYRITGKVD